MNDQFPKPDDADRPPTVAPLAQASSRQARRQLLRAVGASGALAGIGLPFSAHATTRPYCQRNSNNYHATASAVGSMIGSITGGTPPIAGHTCAHYQNSSNWGSGYSNGRGCALSYDTCANPNGATKLRFWQVFALSDPGSGPTYRTCQYILSTYSTSDEAHWLAAMFNANKRSPFAYTPTQVIDLYKGLNPLMGGSASVGLNTQALTLFRDYLSSMA